MQSLSHEQLAFTCIERCSSIAQTKIERTFDSHHARRSTSIASTTARSRRARFGRGRAMRRLLRSAWNALSTWFGFGRFVLTLVSTAANE